MSSILDLFFQFMETGGSVLWAIFALTLTLWILILERYLFLAVIYPKEKVQIVNHWDQRENKSSWTAHRVREKLISENKQQIMQFIPLINTLVTLCPLLGLLGTVTGMISVFDVMAVTGTGSARSMASGISMATIPTMAGMVAALSGIYLKSFLKSKADKTLELLQDHLMIHHM